jgi:hypothetical protein
MGERLGIGRGRGILGSLTDENHAVIAVVLVSDSMSESAAGEDCQGAIRMASRFPVASQMING